ncbi:MAG: hypothetical protein KatS3mg111_0937 [Pirellulaceae bacterium]|nr:MAG: hypothetical protein KatS3mg111_0937 [Pirellulaceae bacterium]
MPRITSLASQAGARQPAVFFAHARLTAFRPMDCVVDALRWWPKLLLSLTLLFGLGASAAQGQTFLERLEEAVRSQLNAGEKPSSDEGQTISKENERQAAGRSDQQPPPAVAELPPPQSSLPVPEPPALPSTGPASGKIYVGLEVVETPGGGIGVRVEEVAAGGPADRGGIRPGDRILAVNGFAIAGIDDLATQLEKTRPGDQIRLLVNRDGRSQEFTVRVIDAALAERELATMSDDEDAPAWLGVVVTDLTESFRQRFGLAVFRGAAVTNVEPNSPAKQADLRPGDAIVELNGTPIESAADLVNWLSGAESGQPVELLFYRGRSPRRVELQLGRVRKRSWYNV